MMKRYLKAVYYTVTVRFYNNNLQFMKLDGESTASFTVKSGVRQGCPLSPVLFALALDPFLTYLAKSLPVGSLVRAYADDMAVILKNKKDINILCSAFKILAGASALHVNVSKTVFIRPNHGFYY